MTSRTAAVGLTMLGGLVFGVAPVAADEPVPTCQGTPATIVGTG